MPNYFYTDANSQKGQAGQIPGGRRRWLAVIAVAILLLPLGGCGRSSSPQITATEQAEKGNIRESVRADYKKLQLIGGEIASERGYFQQNHAKRRSDWMIAAKQSIPEGEYLYGYCFYFGTGENQNRAEAVKWFRKAAEQGLAGAQGRLGTCYMNGEGVRKDEDEAITWIHKAAEQGDANNQLILGALYLATENTKFVDEGVKWIRKAAAQGHEGAKEFLKEHF